MGSSAKTGKNFIGRSQEQKRCTFLGPKHKSAIWYRTPPTHLHIKSNIYVCRRVQGSPIFKQNWIILIHSRFIVILIWVSSALRVGQVGGWYLGWPTIVYIKSGMFRGKESSNRIELSQLVQDLLNSGDFGSLQLWGWVDGSGWWGGATYTHAHACACTCMHVKHDNFMQMAVPIGGILGIPFDVMHVCVHVHMCVGHPPTTPPTSTHPHHPPLTNWGDPQN